MSKFGDKLKNIFTVDYDDDYEDDYYDDFEDDVVEEVEKPARKKRERAVVKEEPAPAPASRPSRTSTFSQARSSKISRNSKVVPMRGDGMEVCVIKPTQFENSKEVIDYLLAGKAVVLNLEGIKIDVAQRIVDLVYGGCYAIEGSIQKISGYIYLVTPHSVDITGDFQELAGSETPDFSGSFSRRSF